jgi:cytochrome P450
MIFPRIPGQGHLPLSGKVRRLASQLQEKITPRGRSAYRSSTAEMLDLSAPDVAINPFPHYEELRRSGPVHFLPRHGFWLVIGFDEVSSAIMQPQLFSSRVPDWLAVDEVLLGSDPPEHTVVRRVVGHYFSAQALAAQSAFAEQAAERLLKPLSAGGTLDALRDFGAPLSEDVAAHLIGFDEPTFAAIRAIQGKANDLSQWLASLNSIIGAAADRIPIYEQFLRNSEGRLDEAQVLSLVRFLWIAGTTTTRRAIASSMLMLLRHTSIRSQVASDPTMLPAFVEESLRLHPPEHSISRVATTEVELSGVKIPAGALMKLCLGAANRDPTQFNDPTTLLLNRTPNRQLSFGGGIHRCVGAALARMEVTAALRVLLRMAPRFRSVQPLDTLRYVGFTKDSEQLVIEC